ncbi:MAG TPA: hypothetical protein H9818_10620 [Candidatus Phocaeicola gallistercoris]|nr:hypothetical protein [Candidatus Phocaeicola gallistercoris]
MKKRVTLLWGTMAVVLVLGLFIVNSPVVKKGVRSVLSSSVKKNISSGQEFSFRYGRIDSMYAGKPYTSFLFMADTIQMEKSFNTDSLLMILPPNVHIKTSCDTLCLPLSAFEYLLSNGEKGILCNVCAVTPDSLSNRYILKKRYSYN